MNRNLVFVYGTLRQHQTNAHLLGEATCMAKQCWTKGRMFDSGYSYPYLISAEGRVYGELYQVNDIQLKALDRLEGYHGENQENHYNRVQQTIYSDKGNYEADVYLLADQSQVNSRNEEVWSGRKSCKVSTADLRMLLAALKFIRLNHTSLSSQYEFDSITGENRFLVV